jgi:hypothetical protein
MDLRDVLLGDVSAGQSAYIHLIKWPVSAPVTIWRESHRHPDSVRLTLVFILGLPILIIRILIIPVLAFWSYYYNS